MTVFLARLLWQEFRSCMKDLHPKIIFFLLYLLSWGPVTGPLQGIVYLGPLFVVGVAFLLGWCRLDLRHLTFFLFLASYAFLFSVYHPDTGLLHVGLAFLTHLSLIIFLMRISLKDPEEFVIYFASLMSFFAFFETSLGVVQFIFLGSKNLSAGDSVVGTLMINAHLFGVKMMIQGMILVFLTLQFIRNKKRIPFLWFIGILFSVLGAFISSYLSGIVVFLLGFLTWLCFAILKMAGKILIQKQVLFHKRSFKMSLLTLVLLVGFPVLMGTTVLKDHVHLLRDVMGVVAEKGLASDWFTRYFGKYKAFQDSVNHVFLTDTHNVLFGTGWGRYSSRSAMILSGGYLTKQPSWIPVSRSQETYEYVYKKWNPDTWAASLSSTMAMPTSSVQAILIEWGALGCCFILFYLFFIFRSLKKARHLAQKKQLLGLYAVQTAISPVLWVAFLLSFLDMWIEFPSFTIPLGLFLVLARSVLMESKPDWKAVG